MSFYWPIALYMYGAILECLKRFCFLCVTWLFFRWQEDAMSPTTAPWELRTPSLVPLEPTTTSPTRRSVRPVSLATTAWPTPLLTCPHLVQQVKKKQSKKWNKCILKSYFHFGYWHLETDFWPLNFSRIILPQWYEACYGTSLSSRNLQQ